MAASTHTIAGVRDAVLSHELLPACFAAGAGPGVQRDFSSSLSDAKAYMSFAACSGRALAIFGLGLEELSAGALGESALRCGGAPGRIAGPLWLSKSQSDAAYLRCCELLDKRSASDNNRRKRNQRRVSTSGERFRSGTPAEMTVLRSRLAFLSTVTGMRTLDNAKYRRN